jgi:hypothetical protein
VQNINGWGKNYTGRLKIFIDNSYHDLEFMKYLKGYMPRNKMT